ncbi:MAG: S-layer protein [Planctomycetaceae bacterium]|nr:S-layer protein [Planctomycetaceae bacterium]
MLTGPECNLDDNSLCLLPEGMGIRAIREIDRNPAPLQYSCSAPTAFIWRTTAAGRAVFERLKVLFIIFLFCGNRATSAADVPVPQGTAAEHRIYFGTDIVPVLTKLGCNGGGCHGKATGQNGFKISLFGFEPDVDYAALVHESRGRRLLPADPERSLLLLKATARMPHGGGRRLEESSDDYRILCDWIAQGATAPRNDDPRLERIELSPREQVLKTNSSQQLRVVAFFSNGTSRDVTRQTVYQSNETAIATIDADGLVKTDSHHGLVAVMARFGEQIATFHAAVPFVADEQKLAEVQRQLDQLERKIGEAPVDRLMLRQWRSMGIVPSEPADDATFVRRVTIDICGTLPTSEEVQSYLTDTHTDKRAKLIDRLLERPEYASYFALKWADILQNRGAGYSTGKQRAGTKLFSGWIRDSLAANKPYDQFVSEILTASGSQNENPPAIWYRTVRKSPEYVESVAQAFLGVRIQCAQCHHHPTESWSQADYFGLAAVFARVGRKGGFADAEVPTDEIIFLKERGEVVHPRTGESLRPRPLGGKEFSLGSHDDPRTSLAHWMTKPDNPYFARTMVNRMWAHFLGRGIVHPIDDARSTNPPSNPELFDALSRDFIASGYDLKQLVRSIAGSYAYGLESAPHAGNAGDTQTFSRFIPRRLTAEVLLDGISQALDVPTEFPGVTPGTRAIDLPDENVAAHFLDVFGRPARMSACECERADAPALTQALELVNSAEIQRKLSAPTGASQQLVARFKSNTELANELFLRVLSRSPRPEELKTAVDFLQSEPDRVEACRSLLWSLLATNEFLFNH